MESRIRRYLSILPILALSTVVVALVFVPLRKLYVQRIAIKNTMDSVDPERLLTEARELMANRDVLRDKNPTDKFAREDERPAYIRALKPTSVLVGTDSVVVEFAGGHFHAGFRALADGVEQEPSEFGSVVIPGLIRYEID